MNFIDYIQLIKYLKSEEGLNTVSAYRNVQRIRKLPVKFKSAIALILKGQTPEIEFHGVTLSELVEKEQMKPVRALLMLDWIRREPVVAMRYLETERLRAPMQISDSDKEKLKEVLQRLKVKNHTIEKPDESDIVIEPEAAIEE